MFDVSIRLLCTKKSGTLSRIIREIKLFGLQYQSHEIAFDDNRTHIVINAIGDLNCTRETLQEVFAKLPEVIEVQNLEVTRDGRDVTVFTIKTSEAHISARERISPAVIMAAEKRLSEILGPVSAFIVESSATSCSTAGELYELLAEELSDPEERAYFLSVIEN